MLYDHYSLIEKKDWPYEWFMPVELASNGDGSIKVNHDAISKLDLLRKTINKPIIINSAYRDPEYNAKVGGSAKSMHKEGRAFDISLRGHGKWHLYSVAKFAGFTGFGFYKSFLHVDTGRRRSWGKWS